MKFNTLKANDFCDSVRDGTHDSPRKVEKGYKLITSKNIREYGLDLENASEISEEDFNKVNARSLVEKNDILYSMIGTIGLIHRVDYIPNYAIKNIGLFKIKDENKSKWLFYYLKTPKMRNYINSLLAGSTQQYITLNNLRELPIQVPENISDMNKTLHILEIIDKKITYNMHTNNNLFEQCNAIYHDYLDKYSELIENKKIVEIANRVVTGKTPSTKNEEFWNGNIPFITIPDMHNQIFTINTERRINKIGAKALIPKNSISVSCIATVGLVSISTEESQTNQQINSIILNNKYDLYYLFEFLSEQENFMKNIAGGSTTYNINKNTFENMEVPYIPSDKIIEFHNIVSKMFEKIKLNQLENNNLEQLRDTLLPKLMNGEIDLDKIEI